MWLSDFQLVLPDRVIPRGSLRIEDGRIAEIVEAPVRGADIVGAGRTILPGFIDVHGDMVEREIEPRPNVRMPLEMSIFELDKKLAASGITTAYAALSFNPATANGRIRSAENTRRTIETILQLRDELLVDHRIHARFEVTFPQAAGVVEDLVRAGALDMVSLMDHTPGQGQYRDVSKYVSFVANARGISEAEAAAVVQARMENTPAAWMTSESVLMLVEAARQHGVPIASHDDDTVEKIIMVHELGVRICEFPVTIEAAQEACRRGLCTVMGAPNALRGMSYSGNLSARGLREMGMLDILASDYHPAAMLQSVFILAELGAGGLPAAAALVTRNPAKACGLDDRGSLEEGMRADLVIAEASRHIRLRATFCAGQIVYTDGTILSDVGIASAKVLQGADA